MKNKHIFLLLMISYCFNFKAINKDSLFKIIRSNDVHDTVKFYAFYDLGWEYIYSNPDTTYLFAKKAFTLAKKFPHKRNQPKILNLIGGYYQIKGDYFQAIEYYQKSMKIGEELNDPNVMLIANGNIGAIYISLSEHVKAKEFLLKSLSIAEKFNKQEQLANIYNNLCVIELNLTNYEKSIHYGNKSLEINKIINDKNLSCSATGNIGNAYKAMKKLDKAQEYYALCYKSAIEANNIFEETRALIDIGNIYFEQKNYTEAVKYLLKAKAIAEKNEMYVSLKEIYKDLYPCYKNLKETDKALDSYENYIKYLELYQQTSKQEEIHKMEVEFQFKNQAIADSIKNAEENKYKDEILNANKAQIENDRLLKIALTVGLLFFIGFGILIFNRFRITTKQKQIIEVKNKQTEEQKLIIEEKQKEILDSINYAKRIQDSIQDNFELVAKFFSDSFLINKPKDIVSGDFYWISKRTITEPVVNDTSIVKELFYIAVCDSTGHGVPGGFMSLLNRAYLSEAINEKAIYQPNKIFDYVRDRLIHTISKNDQKDGFDGVLMCFEKKITFQNKQLISTTLHLNYAAAHNAPLIVRNGKLIELETDKMPVGYGEVRKSFNLHSIEIESNDTIYVYTDGFADQFGGPKGKKFKYRQLNELLLSVNQLPLEQQANTINQKFENWKGTNEQVDDVCMIGIKI